MKSDSKRGSDCKARRANLNGSSVKRDNHSLSTVDDNQKDDHFVSSTAVRMTLGLTGPTGHVTSSDGRRGTSVRNRSQKDEQTAPTIAPEVRNGEPQRFGVAVTEPPRRVPIAAGSNQRQSLRNGGDRHRTADDSKTRCSRYSRVESLKATKNVVRKCGSNDDSASLIEDMHRRVKCAKQRFQSALKGGQCSSVSRTCGQRSADAHERRTLEVQRQEAGSGRATAKSSTSGRELACQPIIAESQTERDCSRLQTSKYRCQLGNVDYKWSGAESTLLDRLSAGHSNRNDALQPVETNMEHESTTENNISSSASPLEYAAEPGSIRFLPNPPINNGLPSRVTPTSDVSEPLKEKGRTPDAANVNGSQQSSGLSQNGEAAVDSDGPTTYGGIDLAAVHVLREKEIEDDHCRGITVGMGLGLVEEIEKILRNKECEPGTEGGMTNAEGVMENHAKLTKFVQDLAANLKAMHEERAQAAAESFQMEAILRKTVAQLTQECEDMKKRANTMKVQAEKTTEECLLLRCHIDNAGVHIEEALNAMATQAAEDRDLPASSEGNVFDESKEYDSDRLFDSIDSIGDDCRVKNGNNTTHLEHHAHHPMKVATPVVKCFALVEEVFPRINDNATIDELHTLQKAFELEIDKLNRECGQNIFSCERLSTESFFGSDTDGFSNEPEFGCNATYDKHNLMNPMITYQATHTPYSELQAGPRRKDRPCYAFQYAETADLPPPSFVNQPLGGAHIRGNLLVNSPSPHNPSDHDASIGLWGCPSYTGEAQGSQPSLLSRCPYSNIQRTYRCNPSPMSSPDSVSNTRCSHELYYAGRVSSRCSFRAGSHSGHTTRRESARSTSSYMR